MRKPLIPHNHFEFDVCRKSNRRFLLLICGYRIVSAFVPRPTLDESLQRHPAAAKRSVSAHRLERILRTARHKPASRWEKGRYDDLVETDQTHQHVTNLSPTPRDHHTMIFALRSSRDNSVRISSYVVSPADFRQTTTKSMCVSTSCGVHS